MIGTGVLRYDVIVLCNTTEWIRSYKYRGHLLDPGNIWNSRDTLETFGILYDTIRYVLHLIT